MNKSLLGAAALACALSLSPVLAEDGKPAETPAKAAAPAKEAPLPHSQQNRMKTCNAEAGKKKLKGEERRAFMSTCLKGR